MTNPTPRPDGFPRVGIVGGGQLARMCQSAAIALGVELRVLAQDVAESAAQVIPGVELGAHDDPAAVAELAAGCDVVTFDHEHVPPAVLAELLAAGVVLRPGPEALAHAQDKVQMRRRLSGAGLPVPNWRLVNTEAELAEFGDQVGWPLVLKTIRGGYDGKGVRVVSGLEAAAEWWAGLGAAEGDGRPALLAEELVRFERELAVLVARSPSGQAAAWPAVQTTQVDGVCREVIAPAPGLAPSRASAATELALRIAGELGVVGVLSVELFDLGSDPTARQGVEPFAGLLVNELAMRPHNAGHWTIDGSVTSQFEQHLRAVLDLPLGAPTCRAPWSVMVNVLGGSDANIYPAYRHVMARDPGAKVHFYGKTVKPGRKIGHVTVSGDDLADCRARAAHAADYLAGTIVE